MEHYEHFVSFPMEAEYVEEFLSFYKATNANKLQILITLPKHFRELAKNELTNVEELELINIELPTDLGDLKYFINLKKLKITGSLVNNIDLAWFPNLTHLISPVSTNFSNIASSNLKECNLIGTKNNKSLKDFVLPVSVEKIVLSELSIQNFESIAHLVNLQHLECYVFSKEMDFSHLDKFKCIENIWLKNVRFDSNTIPFLPTLKDFIIDNSKISDTQFIDNLPNLKRLFIYSKIQNNEFLYKFEERAKQEGVEFYIDNKRKK